MIIAVNCRLRKEEQPEGYQSFLFETLNRATAKFPQHSFLYIFDKPCDEGLRFAKNVRPLIAGPQTSSSLRLQYWLNYKIPAVLRKHKADVFVSMEGICSLRTKIPQCIVLSDLSFLNQPQLVKKTLGRFYKKFTPAFLAKAKTVATVSDYCMSVIAGQYKITGVEVIKPGVEDIFKPLGWEEKELIKEKYAGGKAYFLFSGNITPRSNLINLSKAFSFFKKRQKSNMLLLIAGNAGETFKKELRLYKYRDEVKLLENLKTAQLAAITAAAYALVYPVLYCDFALPPLQAMQCGVPVVTAHSGAMRSVCGNAALYANANDVTDIAENMMLVFKDENLAGTLVKAGYTIMQQYDWNKAADSLMKCVLKCVDEKIS